MPMRAQVQQTNAEIVGGTGSAITRYPLNLAPVALTASGTKYIFKAANANVAAIVAPATILVPFRIVSVLADTPSAVSTWYNIKVGGGAGAGKAITRPVECGFWYQQVTAVGVFALGQINLSFPPTISIDGVNDGINGDLSTNNAAADTINASVYVKTGMGS